MSKKIISVLVMLILSFFIILGGKEYKKSLNDNNDNNETEKVTGSKDEVVLWYSYEYYKEYLETVTEEFKQEYGVNITLKLVNGADMLEAVSKANKTGEGLPDLFITGSENLEKAYLLGVCKENTDDTYTSEEFLEAALKSTEYKGKSYAYPLGFETATMVYNKKYVTDIPKTFKDIIDYAYNFNNAVENDDGTNEDTASDDIDYNLIENILVWDADNMLYDYGFIGDCIKFSGFFSEKNVKVEIDKDKLINSISSYKEIYNYFALLNETDKYTEIVKNFADGKIVFSILNIESIKELEESGIDYGICQIPMLTDELNSKTLALTDLVMVNPYSDDIDITEKYAKYLTNNATYEMYDMIGLLPAKKLEHYNSSGLEEVAKQYNYAATIPSILTYGDYWLKVENMFKDINSGGDITELVNAFVTDMEKMTENNKAK